MPATAILRTLVMIIGIAVLWPSQAALADPGASRTHARAGTVACHAAGCGGAERARPVGPTSTASWLAAVAPCAGEASPDEGCAPSGPHVAQRAERRAANVEASDPFGPGRTEREGPERPPKAAMRITL